MSQTTVTPELHVTPFHRPLLLAVSMAACAGGQTGGEITLGEKPPATADCTQRERRELADEAAPTEVGFSAAQMLAPVVGERSLPLVWSEGEGEDTLRLSVVRGEGAAALSVSPDNPAACPAQLSVPVAITLRSAEGALDVQLAAELVAEQAVGSRVRAQLAADALPSVPASTDDVDGGDGDDGVTLELAFVGEHAAGTLHTTGADGLVRTLAHWPRTPCPPGSVPLSVEQQSLAHGADEMREAIDQAQAVSMRWQSEERASLQVEVSDRDSQLCASTAGHVAALGLSLRIRSDDGRIDATWPAEASSYVDAAGVFRSVSVRETARLRRGAPASDVAEAFGVHGVDMQGFESASVYFSLSFTPNAPHPVQGELGVLGFEGQPCAVEEDTQCARQLRTPLESARVGPTD